jgi:GxxExxY protein
MEQRRSFESISAEEELIGRGVVDAAYKVHKELGPGLLEKVYEVCFCHLMVNKGFLVYRQKDVPIVFQELSFNEGLRLDVMINDLVICELKALETVNPVWEAQILSHLKLTGKRLG